MPNLLTIADVAGSVFRHWADERSEAVTTIHPGQEFDADTLTEWIELWVDVTEEAPQRSEALHRMDVGVSAHAFIRPGTNLHRGRALMSALTAVFRHARFPIRQWSEPGTPAVGTLTFTEPSIQDRTRTVTGERDPSLIHLLFTIRAHAQANA